MTGRYLHTAGRAFLGFLALVFTSSAIGRAGALQGDTKRENQWSQAVSLTIRESFDDNVFLQNVSVLAYRESVVSSVAPAVTFGFQNQAQFRAALAYSADFVRYHSESSENHVTHRGSLNLSGKNEGLSWEFLNGLQVIAGNDQGPNFAPGGDIPAAAGIPLRERRNAVVYRGALRMNWTTNEWLMRPVVSFYDHDFRTQQRARTGAYAGYGNYVDRSEFSAGMDFGRRPSADRPWLMAGYRFGHQRQGTLLGVASPYSNDFHRVLLGVEGTVSPTVKVNVMVGPDFRRFGPNPNPAFRGSEILWFVDASLILNPSAADTVTFTARRFEQPGFGSHSVLEDGTYELAWRRKFGTKFTATASIRTYITDFQAPANREDWVVTPAVTASYVFSSSLSADFGFLRDRAKSQVTGTSARDYTRQLVNAGLKYTF